MIRFNASRHGRTSTPDSVRLTDSSQIMIASEFGKSGKNRASFVTSLSASKVADFIAAIIVGIPGRSMMRSISASSLVLK